LRPPDPWWDLVRLVGLILVAVALSRTVGRLAPVIGLVLLATVVAFISAPVRRLLSHVMKPGLATALTALITFAVVVTVGGLVLHGLSVEADHVSSSIIERFDRLRPGSFAARVVDALDARKGVHDTFGRLPSVVVAG